MASLATIAERLARFDPEPVQRRAMQSAARRVERAAHDAVRQFEALGHQAGRPSRGDLQRSISCEADGNRAVIGSTSMTMRDREAGMSGEPPHGLLGALAAELGESVGAAVAQELTNAIRSALTGASEGS